MAPKRARSALETPGPPATGNIAETAGRAIKKPTDAALRDQRGDGMPWRSPCKQESMKEMGRVGLQGQVS